jgi:hypothetical protein
MAAENVYVRRSNTSPSPSPLPPPPAKSLLNAEISGGRSANIEAEISGEKSASVCPPQTGGFLLARRPLTPPPPPLSAVHGLLLSLSPNDAEAIDD